MYVARLADMHNCLWNDILKVADLCQSSLLHLAVKSRSLPVSTLFSTINTTNYRLDFRVQQIQVTLMLLLLVQLLLTILFE